MNLQDFEKKLSEQESEFDRKIDLMKSDFAKTLEKAKQEAIDYSIESTSSESNSISQKRLSLDEKIDPTAYAAFDKKPYFTIPGPKNSIYVMIPKFYPGFQVGWLKDEVDEYYRYVVNQYSVFFGDVPKELLSEIKMPESIKAQVSGNKITFDPKDRTDVKRELFRYMKDWTDNGATITKGHEFDIIAQILQSGHVPFEKTPVTKEDLVSGPYSIKLRDYQKPSWNNFLKTGAIGVFHPTWAGKSFIGMSGLEHIKVKNRRNLIISPRTTLVEQWNYYLEKNIPHVLDNTVITTYQGFRNFDEEFGLTLFDECQALPAPNFSRLSTIKTKYRMGLSATPFREDNKNHLIITLTGHPQNINWPHYMRNYGPGYHQINVHIINNLSHKIHKTRELFHKSKRTMIYSFGLDMGQTIADKLDLPFIHGDTENRIR
jgi:DNA excision repair protein ERCC-3